MKKNIILEKTLFLVFVRFFSFKKYFVNTTLWKVSASMANHYMEVFLKLDDVSHKFRTFSKSPGSLFSHLLQKNTIIDHFPNDRNAVYQSGNFVFRKSYTKSLNNKTFNDLIDVHFYWWIEELVDFSIIPMLFSLEMIMFLYFAIRTCILSSLHRASLLDN